MKRWIPLLVFLVALSARLVYLYDSSQNPSFATPIVDAGAYDQVARELVEAGRIPSRLFWQPTFYPLFLAFVYWLFGLDPSSILIVKLLQAFLGAGTCTLTYLLGRRLLDSRAGLVAAGITAFYGPLLLFESELLATGWAAFWSVSLVLLVTVALEKGRWWWFFGLGLVAALSVLTRPSFLPFLLVVWVWVGVRVWRGRGGGRWAVGALLLVLLGFTVLALPVARLSQQATGRFSFLPASGGLNAFIGNNPDVCTTVSIRPGAKWGDLVELPLRHGFLSAGERSTFFYTQVWHFVARDPVGFSLGTGRKVLQLLSSRELPRNIDPYLVRRWSAMLSVLSFKVGRFGFPLGFVLPLAVLGLALSWRRLGTPLLLFLPLYALAVVVVFVSARYRLPMVPVLAIPAAAGLVGIPRLLSQSPRRLVAAAGILVGVLLLATVPGPFCEESLNMEADFYYCLGHAQSERGDDESAVQSYLRALGSDPDLEEVHYNLGTIYSDQGELDEAARHYAQAVRIAPDFTLAHNNLGTIRLRQGRAAEAVSHFSEAVRTDSALALAHRNLAAALIRTQRPRAALAALGEAIRLEPGRADDHFLLGGLFLQTGDAEKAVVALREALRLEPSAPVHNELGTALVGSGQIELAVEHFRAATAMDPGYVDGYQNAGAALAILGDLEQARVLFRKAVDLVPESPDAHYGLARVLAGLGERQEALREAALADRLRALKGSPELD